MVVSRSVAELLGAGVRPGVVVFAALAQNAKTPAGWLVVEEFVAAERERRCAVVGLESQSVLAEGLTSEVMVVGEPVATEDDMPEWAKAVAGGFWSVRALRGELNAAREALRGHEERLERIVDAAHVYADDNSLCEAFDRFMESQGLRVRSRVYVCQVVATVRVRIAVSAGSADAAAGLIDDDMVVAALAELRSAVQLSDALRDTDVVDTEEEG